MKLTFSHLDRAIYHGAHVKGLLSLFQIVSFICSLGAFCFFEYFEPKWKEDPFLMLILTVFVVGQLVSFFQPADYQDLLFTFGLEEGFKDVWNDYTQPNNVLSFIELETLSTPTNWLEMGPIFWREDQAIIKGFSQYFGLSTYLKWNWKGLAASVNWKMGWGVNSNYQTTQINPITQELKINGKEEPVTVNDWVSMIEMKVLFHYISDN